MDISELDGVAVTAFNNEDFGNPHLLEDAFQHLIEGLGRKQLVVDLSRVDSVTSLGVAVIVAAQGIALIYGTGLAFADSRQMSLTEPSREESCGGRS